MKFTRTLALIVIAALFFTACSKDPDETVAAVKENTNPLLAYAPADTAYVFADLEPAPVEITDAYIEALSAGTGCYVGTDQTIPGGLSDRRNAGSPNGPFGHGGSRRIGWQPKYGKPQ